jgi:hypothetical protein
VPEVFNSNFDYQLVRAMHEFYEKLTCWKAEHIFRSADGGDAHCQMNDPSLKHQIEFDRLDDVQEHVNAGRQMTVRAGRPSHFVVSLGLSASSAGGATP